MSNAKPPRLAWVALLLTLLPPGQTWAEANIVRIAQSYGLVYDPG